MTEEQRILARHRRGQHLSELLARADAADRLAGREWLIRGRAGSWRVEVADPAQHGAIANPQAATLEEALTIALEVDLGDRSPGPPIRGRPTPRPPAPPAQPVQTRMDLGD